MTGEPLIKPDPELDASEVCDALELLLGKTYLDALTMALRVGEVIGLRRRPDWHVAVEELKPADWDKLMLRREGSYGFTTVDVSDPEKLDTHCYWFRRDGLIETWPKLLTEGGDKVMQARAVIKRMRETGLDPDRFTDKELAKEIGSRLGFTRLGLSLSESTVRRALGKKT
jgi:hypothetical protein